MKNKRVKFILEKRNKVINSLEDVLLTFSMNEIQDIKNYIEQLEKEVDLKDMALDKSCEDIVEYHERLDVLGKDEQFYRTKECWKEWYLKDENI